MTSPKRNTGFTLIELLVVIAIIGILASVVLSSLNSARASARDIARVSLFKNIQTSLELYRNANGSYPGVGTHYYSADCNAGASPAWTSVFNSAYDTYMDVPARDSAGGCMIYSNISNTAWWCYPQASGNANAIKPSDYQYFLVMPVESELSYTQYPRWNNSTNRRCIFGPLR